jgi:hypothetical protein
MWHTFKFFFVWFWLGLIVFVVGLYLLGVAHPGVVDTVGKVKHSGPPAPDSVLVVVLPLLMSIPAYFIARPKRELPRWE